MTACFCAGCGSWAGRSWTPPLHGPVELGLPAPDDSEEGMALGSASWVSARHPVLATEKQQVESQEHLKNDKRRQG